MTMCADDDAWFNRELKPCPFCGGEAAHDKWDEDRDYAGCRKCDFWAHARIWNNRTQYSELAALRTKLEEAERKLAEAHPTTEECEAMGRNGGLPDTPEERTRFEAYMRGHSWEPGPYDGKKGCYWETVPRMLYGVWRDRGALCGSRAQARADGMAEAAKACEEDESGRDSGGYFADAIRAALDQPEKEQGNG